MMNGMDDLITWLRAQLDEDERIARAAAQHGATWRAGEPGIYPSNTATHPGPIITGTWGDLDDDYAQHIARHDPARVLAEVEAKRQIIDAYLPPGESPHPGLPCVNYEGQDPAQRDEYSSCSRHIAAMEHRITKDHVLRLLALPYADRDGYLDEWAPDTP